MNPLRRRLLAGSTLLAAAPIVNSMPSSAHIHLLGDSIFDNAAYVGGQPDVIARLRSRLPAGWKARLLAQDGATTRDIPSQLAQLAPDATHLVLSVGGNDALMRQDLLDTPVRSSADALDRLAMAAREFEASYRRALEACLRRRLPLVVCTIYNGNFPDPAYRQRVAFALSGFNDVIIRLALEKQLRVLELRQICRRPEDYANAIEPSSLGADNIARAIVRTLAETDAPRRGALLLGE
ncbi:SGNH/GDSL hydrolase family protein [Noviherbaspirillum sp. 1P10PC]|uniref:SGNH/GDSL hydrolase family protein n=1 Tax=Noviherbaspirillum sp. 1P10PC TaxID=3132292 RepID=UPI0039A10A37